MYVECSILCVDLFVRIIQTHTEIRSKYACMYTHLVCEKKLTEAGVLLYSYIAQFKIIIFRILKATVSEKLKTCHATKVTFV